MKLCPSTSSGAFVRCFLSHMTRSAFGPVFGRSVLGVKKLESDGLASVRSRQVFLHVPCSASAISR